MTDNQVNRADASRTSAGARETDAGTGKNLVLDIVSPSGSAFSGNVESVTVPGTEGYFQILSGHTHFLSTIQIGAIRVRINGKEEYYATSGGFTEVHENRISILAETAERGTEIDVTRAQAARERAEKRLKTGGKEVDIERARLALFRALNRITIAERV